ncbi:hypothetical protein AAZV13_19G196600 [Glycine max]
MAPTKKPRTTTNKRFSSLSEVSPKKDEVGSSKNKQRVAENVSSRSVEMVKALHSISQFPWQTSQVFRTLSSWRKTKT